MERWQKWALAGIVVVGLAAGKSMQNDGQPSPDVPPHNTKVYIKVVQQEYPGMSGAEAVALGGAACDAFDIGGDWMAALRAVALEDRRTERARYVVDAATLNLCPEHRHR